MKTVISENSSADKTEEIDWRELDDPDKDQTHILHDLSDIETASLAELKKSVKDKGQLVTGNIQCGQSLVQPFDIEIFDGKEQELLKVHEKPYGLKGDHRILLKKCMDEMEQAGVGSLNEEFPDIPINYASPAFFAKKPRSPKL